MHKKQTHRETHTHCNLSEAHSCFGVLCKDALEELGEASGLERREEAEAGEDVLLRALEQRVVGGGARDCRERRVLGVGGDRHGRRQREGVCARLEPRNLKPELQDLRLERSNHLQQLLWFCCGWYWWSWC